MVRSVDRSRSCSRSTEVGKLWTKKANRLFRYTRLIVDCISHWTFRPIPVPETPTYTSDDVTIILPTIATGGLVNCISHWTFRPILIPENPTYTSDDVTIILPTIATINSLGFPEVPTMSWGYAEQQRYKGYVFRPSSFSLSNTYLSY